MSSLEAQSLAIAEQNAAEILSGGNPRILIDGRSGSGKTLLSWLITNQTFALTQTKPQIVHMDDLYPGWEGLRLGASMLINEILLPLSKGQVAEYQIWDWHSNQRGATGEQGNGWRAVQPDAPLIVEGCGAVSSDSKRLVNSAIWIESSIEARLERLSTRDRGAFRAHQALWGAQEDEFYSQENTIELCDIQLQN